MIADDDPRLAINQAAEVIQGDYAWLGAVAKMYAADQAVAKAQRILVEAKADQRAAHVAAREHWRRLGADNAVPGRSVPNLIAAAQRELGLGRFANGART